MDYNRIRLFINEGYIRKDLQEATDCKIKEDQDNPADKKYSNYRY